MAGLVMTVEEQLARGQTATASQVRGLIKSIRELEKRISLFNRETRLLAYLWREDVADEAAGDLVMMPGEVAALFRVNPKAVSRWVADGRLTSFVTLGGHHRFRACYVREAFRELLTTSRVPTSAQLERAHTLRTAADVL